MRKTRITIALILLFLVSTAVIFALAGGGEKTREETLYFFSSNGSRLMPVETPVSIGNESERYQNIAEALIKGPSGKKYKPIMDKSVKLNSISKEGSSLTVDFSEEYRKEGILTTYAVIKSFCRLNDIFRVRVTAGGRDISGGFIEGDEINIDTDDDSTRGIKLYFADSDKKMLDAEYRKITITDTQHLERYVLNELLKGPNYEDHTRLIASDTGILSVETTEGTCYINFKQDFIDKNIAPQEVQKLMIYSIVNSLTELEGIQNVQILIDGKKTEKFGEMNISELFYRNTDIIKN